MESSVFSSPKKIGFQTLGCRLNQYETEAISSQFLRAGYQIVDYEEKADAYILNTCTVTTKSDRKSRHLIHQAKNKDAVVVVTGCYAQSAKESLERDPQITYVVDNKVKSHIFSLVDSHFKGETLHPDNLKANLFDYAPLEQVFKTRGMLKIQDGCDNFCTFCIIPFVRGKAVSRPLNEILATAQEMIEHGYREIVLTGVNMSRYASSGMTFNDVIEGILSLPGEFRLRLSSLEPENIDERFLSLLSHPKMTSHLHLCLQSASERILLRMRREYTYAEYAHTLSRIRSRHPFFNITTDLIIGFPGESAEDFSQSVHAVEEMAFGHVHIFPYSIRHGTRAARFEDQISDTLKKKRSEILHEIALEQKKKYRSSLKGKKETVLIEKSENGISTGYSSSYVPVRILHSLLPNHFYEVELGDFTPQDLEFGLEGILTLRSGS